MARAVEKSRKKEEGRAFNLKELTLENLTSFPTPLALPFPLTHRPFCLPLALGLSYEAWLGHRRLGEGIGIDVESAMGAECCHLWACCNKEPIPLSPAICLCAANNPLHQMPQTVCQDSKADKQWLGMPFIH